MSNFFAKPESESLALSEQLVYNIEQASMRAWPALEELELGDWRLRFSKGFTKRANSISITNANCHVYSDAELLDKIQVCEQYYHHREQPAIFRIVQKLESHNTSPAVPPNIDRLLASRNYTRCDASLVLVKVLVKKLHTAVHTSSSISYVELPTWLSAYQNISDSPRQAEQLHRLILEGIQADLLLALTRHKQQNIACALGVPDGSLLGLFDVATHPDFRKKGYASALVKDLCAQGLNSGAKYVYLQVQEDNFAALALYAALGFNPAYRYGYRIEDV